MDSLILSLKVSVRHCRCSPKIQHSSIFETYPGGIYPPCGKHGRGSARRNFTGQGWQKKRGSFLQEIIIQKLLVVGCLFAASETCDQNYFMKYLGQATFRGRRFQFCGR